MAELEGLQDFLAVVENGSFTAAAQTLNASKSHISRQVSRLEGRLGTRLLTRTTRRVRLTDMGRLYYDRCRSAVDALEAVEADLADLQARPKGLVRLTAPGIYAERFVAPALAEFATEYPEVEVELDTQMSTVDLIEDGYDLAIRMSSLTDSSLIARRVEARRIVVCGAPEYLEKRGVPDSPDALTAHDCLTLKGMAWRFAWPDQIREVRVRGGWTSDNGRALVAAASAGLGLMRITDYYVNAELARGELQVVLEDYEVGDAATWIIYPNRQHLPTRVRLLIDFLVEALRGRYSPGN
ncbi:MAG: LysR substrate-binding domain-containing protein [Gammaproteobacteria bacterium]|nr:LysR substrate-binding domain-containing protein [Gammaproteobacteria bacterium]